MRLALGLALLASTALALPPRPGAPVPPTTVAIGVDGGPVTVTCTNCTGGGGAGGSSSLVWVDGGRLSADVLSIPAIYIADGGVNIENWPASQAVTGPLTDTQMRATPIPISGTVTATVTGATLGAGSALIGHVVTDTGSTTTITGNVAVTAVGPDGGTTFDVSGSVLSVAPVAARPNPFPLNPFLPRCNPVRRTGCQP